MCNYCKKNTQNGYKTEDHADWQLVKFGGVWTLEMITEYQDDGGYYFTITRELEIEYCPFCGRKLGEE